MQNTSSAADQRRVAFKIAVVAWGACGGALIMFMFGNSLPFGLRITEVFPLIFAAALVPLCPYLAWSSWRNGIVELRSGPVRKAARPIVFNLLIFVLALLGPATALAIAFIIHAAGKHVV